MDTQNIESKIDEFLAAFEEVLKCDDSPSRTKTIVTVLVEMGRLFLEGEAKDLGDLAREHEWFETMSRMVAGPIHPLQFLTFRHWVARSANSYAVAYRLGSANALREAAEKNVRRATNGRKLIGATTRAKVKAEAEKYRHKSKEDAAFDIAAAVSLSPGTVRRYLSELFPGIEWKNIDASPIHHNLSGDQSEPNA